MIDLTLTPDQQALAEGFSAQATRLFPRDELLNASRAHQPFSVDVDRWSEVAASGMLGVGASRDVGGLGLGVVEEVLLHLALGQAPASGPITATAVAATVAEMGGAADVSADLVAGRTRAAFVVSGVSVEGRVGDLGLALSPDGAELAEITGLESEETFDVTTSVARVRQSAPPIISVTGHLPLRRSRALLAAYLIGMAEAATTTSADYAKLRHQFGKPIGTFQAVKHRCAEMATRAYGAKAELFVAATLLDASLGDNGQLETDSAYFLAIRAAKQNADDNVQNHGGIGMTAEHISGIFVKRAHLYSRIAGTERQLVASLLASPRSEVR